MAVRAPLYLDGTTLKEMSTTQVAQIVDQAIWQFAGAPSPTLSVISTGGALASINDTRLQAGSVSTSATAFPNEATTAEPTTVTVAYDKIDQIYPSVSPTADTGKTWPVYYTSGGQIQSMNLTDVKDTFLHPAIDLLVSGSTTTQQAGTYAIQSDTSMTGATLVSATPVFIDTRADTGAYTAGGITEALDQPTTITSYYLHRVNGNDTTYTLPSFIRSDNDIQVYDETVFENLLQEWMRYTAASSTDGYKISYNIGTSGSGNTRGTGMADTVLNGSGNYQTRYVNTDDYRAQEFPNGAVTTANTYYLRIAKS
tara:strand:+ start:12530 stop:13465 length:936 start_codon:yes stop_codon:yes gene_type:complete